MSGRITRGLRAAVAALALLQAAPGAAAATDAPPAPGRPHAARSLPDRIVLSPGARAADEMAVAYRTDLAQAQAIGQIAPALDGPLLERHARELRGSTHRIETRNGAAHYHQLRFTGLQAGTRYAYRLRGSAGWSEWHQFRTAGGGGDPLRVLYFGDLQNDILSLGARVVRQGLAEGRIDLVLHAGDLVSQRDDLDHDDEWGEWTAAGGAAYAAIAQLPAAGNHEYVKRIQADGSERRELGPHWPLQFALPRNGAPGAAERTSYAVDHGPLRVVVLDGTSALELGTLAAQSQWLERALTAVPRPRWSFVVMHQPLFTCARRDDTERLKAAWQPLFERLRVDLVLQGHDHCYSRLSEPAGRIAGARRRAAGATQGPVYLVSVAGSKMHALNARAGSQPDRVAESTQLYQVIELRGRSLTLRSYSAAARLYDGFELRRGVDGRNRLRELIRPAPAPRRCSAGVDPDGGACAARAKD